MPQYLQLEPGLLLELYFSGPFYTQAGALAAQVQDYLQRNGLCMVSDVFVVPIENHWLSRKAGEYVNKIFARVTPQQCDD